MLKRRFTNININRETFLFELSEFIKRILSLPEVSRIIIRDEILKKGEVRTEFLQKAVERSYHDCYSDIDLTIVIKMNPADKVSPIEYLRCQNRFGINTDNCLGYVFFEENMTYRVIYKNGMRFDIVFQFECDNNAESLNLVSDEEVYSNPNWPVNKVNSFWFVQIQALGKLYRKDFLIADHLANLNLNETLVQQMVLRDLAYGKKHHRYGYEDNITYADNKYTYPVLADNELFNMIAEKIYRSALAYDELTAVFYPEYKGRSQEFFDIWKYYEDAKRQEALQK